MEDGYEFFARRQLVTLFSAPNYCGDYDNAGGMMTIDQDLMCSFQVERERERETERRIINVMLSIIMKNKKQLVMFILSINTGQTQSVYH